VLDPFDISGQTSAAFNPLAGLDPDSLDLAEDAEGDPASTSKLEEFPDYCQWR
jgi:hypothetical protein